MVLNEVQARVLGALIEKEISTPDIYPLSLNALRNACNQSSSREPVMNLDEEQVRQGLHALQDLGLADSLHDSRVPKFEHRVRDVLHLKRDEVAVLCLLLLRGPQTPGEIRGRSDRLYNFDGTDAVLSTLQRLASRDEPLTILLPRAAGAREARWAQTLTPLPENATAPTAPTAPFASSPQSAPSSSLVEDLRAEIVTLTSDLANLRAEVEDLRSRLDRLSGS